MVIQIEILRVLRSSTSRTAELMKVLFIYVSKISIYEKSEQVANPKVPKVKLFPAQNQSGGLLSLKSKNSHFIFIRI